MSFFQFQRDGVSNAISQISQQQQVTNGVMDTINGYVPKIQGAWIGGDANEFASDVARKLIPAIMELIAAIAGVNLNLSKATGVVDQADAKIKSLADGLGDMFDKI